VLAVDIEPRMIDAYRGEDLFIDAHRELMHQCFWLSNLSVCGTVRMRRSTLNELTPETASLVQLLQRPSPGWGEARYLRTVEWLTDHSMPAYRYRLLWIFAILDDQYGYALDVASVYGQRFGIDEFADLLKTIPLTMLKDRKVGERNSKRKLKRFVGKLAHTLGF